MTLLQSTEMVSLKSKLDEERDLHNSLKSAMQQTQVGAGLNVWVGVSVGTGASS